MGVTVSPVCCSALSKPETVEGVPWLPSGTVSVIEGSPMNMYAVPSIRAIPAIAVTWPCQNCCHVPGSAVAGSQVLR